MAEMSCLQIHDANDAVFNHCNHYHHHHHNHLRDQSLSQIFDSLPHWVQSNNVDLSASESDFSSGDVSVSDLVFTAADGLDLLDRRSFVMDLFHQRVEQSQVSPLYDDGIDDFKICEMRRDSLEFDFGLELESSSGFVDSDLVVNLNEHDLVDGMRLLGIESGDVIVTVESRCDSDDEDEPEKEYSEIWGIDLNEDDEYVDEDDDEEDACVTLPLCWDSLHFEDLGINNEEFEWEEVDGDDEREGLSVLAGADDNNSVSVSGSATISLEDLAISERRGSSIGWEVLLNSSSLEFTLDDAESNMELCIGDIDHEEEDDEDYLHTTEYEMLFEAEISSGLGKPPASKSFIKNLKVFPLTTEDIMENDGMCCAVCKEEMNLGKEVAELPCRHKYHSECIVPWLGIRNTCPICRFELPSD